jgi:hypothetical protein
MSPIDETPEGHILDRSRVDWCITCGARAFGVGCAFAQQVTGKKNSPNSPIWGAETPRRIIMNFGLLVGLADIMNSLNFCIDRLRGFCSVKC